MTTSTKRVFGKITTQDEHEHEREREHQSLTTTVPAETPITATTPTITTPPLHRNKRARTTLTLQESIRIYDTAIAIDKDFNYFELTSMLNGSPKRRGSRRPRQRQRQRRPGINKQSSIMSVSAHVNSLSPLLLFPSPLPSSLLSSSSLLPLSPFSMSLATHDQRNTSNSSSSSSDDSTSSMEQHQQQQNRENNLDCSELVTMTESLHVKDFHHNKGGHNCRRGAISINSTR